MLSVSLSTAGSAHRPPGSWHLPICRSPFRNVPAVMIVALALNVTPQTVLAPTHSPFSTIISQTWSCHISRLGVLSRMERHSQINFPLSHCALGDQTAGPLPRLSILNCIAVLSVTIPICPPNASISLTICPFAIPPTAGLQLICPILFMSIVIRQVLAPMLAAAAAASHPACPPPITMTS